MNVWTVLINLMKQVYHLIGKLYSSLTGKNDTDEEYNKA